MILLTFWRLLYTGATISCVLIVTESKLLVSVPFALTYMMMCVGGGRLMERIVENG